MEWRSADEGIRQFWAWWRRARGDVLAEIHAGADAAYIGPLNEHVRGVHPELEWEFGPGRARPHHLALSGRGSPKVRAYAGRWAAAAPDDRDFEFHPARQRDALRLQSFGGVEFAAVRVRLEPDDVRERFDVTLHHPGMGDPAVKDALWMALDWALGEDAVETWLRGVAFTAEPAPPEAVDLPAFVAAVDRVSAAWTGARGTILKERLPSGDERIYAALLSAKFQQQPWLDLLCLAERRYADAGMPSTSEQAALDAFGAAVEVALRDEVVQLCRAIGAGERRYWLYLRAEDGAAREALEILARAHGFRATFEWDPGWTALPTR